MAQVTKRDTEMLHKLGSWIKLIRGEARLTRQQLADAAGLSVMAVAYIENGKRWPRPSSLERIAEALDVSVHDLFHTFEKA